MRDSQETNFENKDYRTNVRFNVKQFNTILKLFSSTTANFFILQAAALRW